MRLKSVTWLYPQCFVVISQHDYSFSGCYSNKGAAISSMDSGASEDGYGYKAYQRTDSGQYVDIYDKL